jgi:hypothetical protein
MHLADVAPDFVFVSHRSFAERVVFYSPEKFGDAEVILAGPSFSLRIKRDRGQVFVDAGTAEGVWFKLEYVLEFVDAALTQDRFGAPPQPAVLAQELERHFAAVEALFADATALPRLEQFCKAKSAALIASIFGRR